MPANLSNPANGPVVFFDSDTSGEKPFKEFFSREDIIDWDRFRDIEVITAKRLSIKISNRAEHFIESVMELRSRGTWKKRELIELIVEACPDFKHVDTGRYLDEKM